MENLIRFFRKQSIPSLFGIAFFLNALYVNGMNSRCEETVLVHFDKEVYTVGDGVHFKAYLLNGTHERVNSIIYFSLIGKNTQDVFHWRIPVANSMASGFFHLPEHLQGGIYEIRAYTNAMRCTNAEAVFKTRILVIEFIATTGDSLFLPVTGRGEISAPVQKTQGIEMKVLNSRITPGEKMKIDLKSDAEDTVFLSLSVYLETPFSKWLKGPDLGSSGSAFPETSMVADSCHCLQESNGFILAGTLLQRSSRMPVTGADILLAVTDSTWPALLYAKTDGRGDFSFFLNSYYDNHDLIIQLADSGYKGDLIWIIEDKSLRDTPEMVAFRLDETQKKFIQILQETRMIEAVFGNGHDTTLAPVLTPVYSDFFIHPDKTARPVEYVNMRNFNEMDDNILPLIRFFRRGNRYSLSVYNAGQNTWYEDVLLLLNGVPFYDLEYIGMLNTSQVKRVDTYASGLIVGGLSYDGVVSIYTNDNTLPEAYLQSGACIWHNKVMTNGYINVPETSEDGDRIPEFRDNLCFMPDLTIGPGETLNIECNGSLMEGTFGITLNGITAMGKPVCISSRFTIKQDND